MLRLDNPHRPMPKKLLQSPGGFAWWYLEILDEKGDGLVLIWSFGLPFLPGYASATRAGQGQHAGQRPSLNLALYKGGEQVFYLLHEFEPEDAHWDGNGSWRFGATRIHSTTFNKRRAVRVQIDSPVLASGGHLSGLIEASGAAVRIDGESFELGQSRHCWTPMMGGGSGRASLTLDNGDHFELDGHCYHDRNGSPEALHDLGIKTWVWGHASFEDRDRIFYILWPENHGEPRVVGVDLMADGRVVPREDLVAELSSKRRTFYGMPWHERITLHRDGDLWLDIETRARIDDGPFYLRFMTEAASPLGMSSGSAEVIVPSRIDLARHRPLVKMRVASEARPNSMWLPLFQGPREGRVARLLRQIAPSIAMTEPRRASR